MIIFKRTPTGVFLFGKSEFVKPINNVQCTIYNHAVVAIQAVFCKSLYIVNCKLFIGRPRQITVCMNISSAAAKNTSEEYSEVFYMMILKSLCIASKTVKIIKVLTVIKLLVALFAFGLIIRNTLCAISE